MRTETSISIQEIGKLRVEDFICQVCKVRATREGDHVRELCRNIGKRVDPDPDACVWSDIRFGGVCAKRFVFGLNA